MSPDFRKGRDAIEGSPVRSKGSGNNAWAPTITWREDQQKRYVVVLTPVDEVVRVDLHEWVKVGSRQTAKGLKPHYETFLSRKDPLIGEAYDDLEDRLGQQPRSRCIGVMAELEATEMKGKRPVGFTVSTRSYTSRRDEEEVTVPNVGLVIQSSRLMWKPLLNLDDEAGPLINLPLGITRSGMGTDTHYDIFPYVDAPIDFSPLVDHAENLSYIRSRLTENPLDSDPEVQATQISDHLITAFLYEVMDAKRYQDLVGPLAEVYNPFGPPSAPRVEAENESPSEQFESLKAKLAGKSRQPA